MKVIITLCLSVVAFLAISAPPMQDIERESDSELFNLLTNSDSFTRCDSLMILGLRFNNPDAIVAMSPAPDQVPYPTGIALPRGLLERTMSLAKADPDIKVRLLAVAALEQFKCRTNTTPILKQLLKDRTCIIQIRAAQALMNFANEYHEPISDNVVSTLINCLDTTNSPDDIWQAEESLGNLGARGKKALPFLAKLKHNKSPEVREYAGKAIRKIQKGLIKQKN